MKKQVLPQEDVVAPIRGKRSLAGTGKKSTSLGLNFVQEVAQLHGGSVHLENTEPGLRASLVLPVD